MKIEKLTNQNLKLLAQKTADTIATGGIVVAPFDTVYGFACDAANNDAVLKIFEIKNRDLKKTIGIAVDSFESLEKIAKTNDEQKKFIKDKIPGKFTFILPLKNEKLISKYCQKDQTVGVRIPDKNFILCMIKIFDKPIAQTSANKSGKGECANLEQFMVQYNQNDLEKIDLIVDSGNLKNNIPSEIIDLTKKLPQKIERV